MSNDMGLAFAWFTWHRLAGGKCECSYVYHEWWIASNKAMWQLWAHPGGVLMANTNCQAHEP